MTKNLCFAGYDMGNGERCKVCKATSNESCRRGYEVVNRLEGQRDQLLAELREATRLMVNHQADEYGPRENWPAREQIERQEAAIAAAEPRP